MLPVQGLKCHSCQGRKCLEPNATTTIECSSDLESCSFLKEEKFYLCGGPNSDNTNYILGCVVWHDDYCDIRMKMKSDLMECEV